MTIDTKRLATDPGYCLLASRYSYDPETGEVFGSRGAPLKTKNAGGYIRVRTRQHGKYVDVLGHRLAFFLMTGRWPKGIDHINGVVDDNRWCNLREADQLQNSRNMALSKLNKTGVCGVHRRGDGKYRAAIGSRLGKVNIGTFQDFFDAVCARKSAEVEMGYHENHGRRMEPKDV